MEAHHQLGTRRRHHAQLRRARGDAFSRRTCYSLPRSRPGPNPRANPAYQTQDPPQRPIVRPARRLASRSPRPHCARAALLQTGALPKASGTPRVGAVWGWGGFRLGAGSQWAQRSGISEDLIGSLITQASHTVPLRTFLRACTQQMPPHLEAQRRQHRTLLAHEPQPTARASCDHRGRHWHTWKRERPTR